ncbi:hypothetical protein AFK16_000939 [Salmonella enterica subsp. enterica]|nr:hypothetical protein [Salmonella enterica subsp. enterica]
MISKDDFLALSKRINYFPETGLLFWNENNYRTFKNKQIKNVCSSTGYGRIGYTNSNGKPCHLGAHQYVWMLYNGEIPDGFVIDHIDRNRTNNKVENLRLVTRSQNCCNASHKKGSATGIKNVNWNKNRNTFQVSITCNGVHHYYGNFESLADAVEVAKKARLEIHGEYALMED